MRELISFNDYELISDMLVPLGQGFILKMNVNLANKSVNNERQPFSNEYLYRTNKYINKDKVVNIKRKFFPYLSIEYKDELEIFGKGMVRITHYDILGFRDKVIETDRALGNAFAIKNKKLIITADKKFEISIMISDAKTKITFKPIVMKFEDMSYEPGVRMEINQRIYVDMYIKSWKAFAYYISIADLYGWASTMISGYTQNTIGQNLSDMRSLSRNPSINEEIPSEMGFNKTKPLTNEEKRKSFFDE